MGTELDKTKWDYRMSMMGMNWPAWTDKGVHLDGKGNAVFTLMLDDNGNPVSSQLQTGYNFMDQPIEKTVFGHDHLQWNIGKLRENKYTHSHGYYECRCRLQQKEGWWSAFWIQADHPYEPAIAKGGPGSAEIDIVEGIQTCVTLLPAVEHNVHTAGYPDGSGEGLRSMGAVSVPVENCYTEYHTYALEWTPEYIKTYVDGKQLFYYNPDSYPKGRNADTWPFNKPFQLKLNLAWGGDWGGMYGVDESCLPATFEIDYVRVFQIAE